MRFLAASTDGDSADMPAAHHRSHVERSRSRRMSGMSWRIGNTHLSWVSSRPGLRVATPFHGGLLQVQRAGEDNCTHRVVKRHRKSATAIPSDGNDS